MAEEKKKSTHQPHQGEAETPEQSAAHSKHGAGTRGPRAEAEDKAIKERDVAFLVDEFDVETHDAAELVTENEAEADEVARHDHERQRQKDPLEDVPTPHSPDDGRDQRAQNHMRKEVLHDRKS